MQRHLSRRVILWSLGLLCLFCPLMAQEPSPDRRALIERAARVTPSERQIAWQRREFIGFVHFGPNTFTDRSWGTGTENPSIFNPTALDCRQWVRAFKDAGMTQVIVTAKHHDGFCLWPSRFTAHSVRNAPWRDGQGDVLRELAEACREAGLKLGVYLSPADLNAMETGLYGRTDERARVIPTPVPGWTPQSTVQFKGNWDDYNTYFMNQLYELLTEYGEISEVWFDGANPKPGTGQTYAYADWYRLIRALQPTAVIFGKGPDVRWCGNEAGRGRTSEWSVIPLPVRTGEFTWPDMTGADLGSLDKLSGAPFLHWYPSEVDVSIRPEWFWHAREDDKVKSLEQLMGIYHASVGNNSVLLLNVPPDQRGLIHENDVKRLSLFGRLLRQTFAENLARGAQATASATREQASEYAAFTTLDGDPDSYWTTEDWQTQAEIVYHLPAPKRFNLVMLQEALRRGQRIESFAVDAWVGGSWREIAAGTTVGHKRLAHFPEIESDRVRVRILGARLSPTLSEFGLFLQPEVSTFEEAARATPAPIAFHEGGKILFLGDSITYSGQYVDYVDAALRTLKPGLRVEILNLGLPSETVSGLSEPGHAGGTFPRPDLHERLDRVLAAVKPDVVFACYGMNDGIYYPLGEDRFQSFQQGILRLREKVEATGARLIHLTPPTFDPVPIQGRTLPAGRDEYRQPYEGYNTVLDRYSEWLLDQRSKGWAVIDIHGPMNEHLANRRRTQPGFQFAGDGVHANPTGHWLMARGVLNALGIHPSGAIAELDLARNPAATAPDGTGLNWELRLPMPMDPAWDPESVTTAEMLQPVRFVAHNGSSPFYNLFEGDTRLATVSREELEAGIDLRRFPGLTTSKRGVDWLQLVRERNNVLRDAWLKAVGHKRPGMGAGLPIGEAELKAQELLGQIKTLQEPVTLRLRLTPAAAAFPGKRSEWNGYDRFDFTVGGKPVLVVAPREPAPNRPWVWHGEFFGHKPAPDIALLGKGFYIVYMSVPDMLGCPDAVGSWNLLYEELTVRHGFARKAALVGLSRGGLYCYNWASANPDKVACIYGDAPVCDFKSWPGGKGKGPGSKRDWDLVLSQYHFANEAEALAYPGNPVDRLEPLAKAGVPLLHVYGDADEVVPWEENTGLLAERYRALGGSIQLIGKPGVRHHPHGLEDSTPIIDFILKNSP
jgi:alpha-L-fucosidase/lysophospholipase L1-like esterase/pimeloyl-ACP methyl ester carboxylesterase